MVHKGEIPTTHIIQTTKHTLLKHFKSCALCDARRVRDIVNQLSGLDLIHLPYITIVVKNRRSKKIKKR